MFYKIKLVVEITRALISEIIAKQGIKYAFTLRTRRSLFASFMADLLYKGSCRGSILFSLLKLNKDDITLAKKRLDYYQKKANRLKIFSKTLENYNIKIKSLIPKIYSLVRSWRNSLPIPRQIQYASLNINKSSNKSRVLIKNNSNYILHVITEDHEWSITPGKSEGKPYLSLREAEIQLIKKGRLVNQIANECGVPWTHLIDIGSYMLISKAAEYYPNTWGVLVNDFHTFLGDTIESGNDLGVHVHPEKSYLATNKIEAERIWINENAPTWGELKRIDDVNNPESKLGMIVAGKNLVEKYGKLVDPNFKVTFFRAGSYATGRNFQETIDSMKALWRAGIYVASDALLFDGITESLGRPSSGTVYFAKFGFPWESADEIDKQFQIQALPTRCRDFPVYSVIKAARLFHRNLKVLNRLIKTASDGQGYLISIDHDIEIGNLKKKGQWDCLDPDKGDWNYLKNYLFAVKQSNAFKCIRACDFVDEIMKNISIYN